MKQTHISYIPFSSLVQLAHDLGYDRARMNQIRLKTRESDIQLILQRCEDVYDLPMDPYLEIGRAYDRGFRSAEVTIRIEYPSLAMQPAF